MAVSPVWRLRLSLLLVRASVLLSILARNSLNTNFFGAKYNLVLRNAFHFLCLWNSVSVLCIAGKLFTRSD